MYPSKNVPIAPLTYRHGHFFIDGLSFEFMWYNGNEKIFPLTTEITESVYASAVVQPDYLYDVHAPVNGILDHIQVQEGDTVQQGDVLFKSSLST